MKKNSWSILVVATFLALGNCDAAEQWHPMQPFLTNELFVLANSGLATASPRIFGIAAIALFPMGVANDKPLKDVGEWTSFIGAEGIATSDAFAVDENRVSRVGIFLGNFVAWQLVFGAEAVAKKITRGTDTYSFSIIPSKTGGKILLAWKFDRRC